MGHLKLSVWMKDMELIDDIIGVNNNGHTVAFGMGK
jgi:hypothetical protein